MQIGARSSGKVRANYFGRIFTDESIQFHRTDLHPLHPGDNASARPRAVPTSTPGAMSVLAAMALLGMHRTQQNGSCCWLRLARGAHAGIGERFAIGHRQHARQRFHDLAWRRSSMGYRSAFAEPNRPA